MATNPQPPTSGHALRYEILQQNESRLKSIRQDLLDNDNDEQRHEKIQHLNIQTIFHRTSLQCLIHSAKEVARMANKVEDIVALDDLSRVRNAELVEELHLPKCVGFEHNNNSTSNVDISKEPPDVADDLADRFFDLFPEVARTDELNYSSSDESSVEEIKTKKQKGSSGQDIIVVSGEDTPKIDGGEDLKKNRKNQQFTNGACPLNSGEINRTVNGSSSRLNSNSNHNQQQANNPYTHRYNPPQHQLVNHQQQQNNQWKNRTSTDCFDYNEAEESQKQPSKENAFRTAKEMQGKLDNNSNDWENHESISNKNGFRNGRMNNRNGWSNSNDEEHYRCNNNNNNSNSMNNRANNTSRPQQLVQTALAGPKNGMSKGIQKKFQNPMSGASNNNGGQTNKPPANKSNPAGDTEDELPEELKGCTKELIERIEHDIVDSGEKVSFRDIAGLEHAKKTVDEMIIMPMRNPMMFTGLREAPKGLLLFGPPGTGKTLIAKAIANESGATFFSISSSSLTSKWIGEGEQLVRTLFKVARYRAPSVVFIDEVDSMLTARKADENEASRRMKTEFLVQLDGAGDKSEAHVLLIGATNRPQELDDAARRRFVKRLYVALPETKDREVLLRNLLSKNHHIITDKEFAKLAKNTKGFSGADLKNLCTDAAMGPVRQLGANAMTASADDLPPISYKHCRQSLKSTSPSVAQADLTAYLEWNENYGTKASIPDDIDTESDHESSDEEEEP